MLLLPPIHPHNVCPSPLHTSSNDPIPNSVEYSALVQTLTLLSYSKQLQLSYLSTNNSSINHPTTHPNPSDNRNPTQQPPPNHQHQSHNQALNQTSSVRTPLAALASDEALISYRKRALARYGANWLRPPGVSKTLQGRDDERAEREEAELQREQEARAEEEMRAQELAEEEMEEGEGGEGEGEEEEEEGMVDLDAEVPDADVEAEEWSSDEEEEDEEDEDEDEVEGVGDEDADTGREAGGAGRQIGAGMFDGPSTPVHDDDRTPQRFRLNPFQAPTAEGDGDYGSPLAARNAQRAATVRVGELSPGVMAAIARRGGQGASAGTGAGINDVEADLDDAVPMDETMIDEGSYENTDNEVEDMSSQDEGLPGNSAGLGSRSVFRSGAIGAAVRRISGQERRASGGGQRRASGDRRVSGDRRASGRTGTRGRREN